MRTSPRISRLFAPGVTIGPTAVDQVWAMLDEPLTAAVERLMLVATQRVDDRGAKQRHEADHGAGANGNRFAVGRCQVIVKESIAFVPQRFVRLGEAIHRVRDVNEVLPEFAGEVFVDPVFFGQDQCDRQHAAAKAAIQLVPSAWPSM